jgi:hypothetical protein
MNGTLLEMVAYLSCPSSLIKSHRILGNPLIGFDTFDNIGDVLAILIKVV